MSDRCARRNCLQINIFVLPTLDRIRMPLYENWKILLNDLLLLNIYVIIREISCVLLLSLSISLTVLVVGVINKAALPRIGGTERANTDELKSKEGVRRIHWSHPRQSDGRLHSIRKSYNCKINFLKQLTKVT